MSETSLVDACSPGFIVPKIKINFFSFLASHLTSLSPSILAELIVRARSPFMNTRYGVSTSIYGRIMNFHCSCAENPKKVKEKN